MKGISRQHGKLMRISQIHQGQIITQKDKSQFFYNNEWVGKVRIFGLVIERYDSPSGVERAFSTILIDDGSDTINLKLWSRPIEDLNNQITDIYDILKGINPGQIIDVLGIVREYEEDKYIIPSTVAGNLSMEWEIHRRTQLLEIDFENKGIGDDQLPFNSEKETDFVADANMLFFVLDDNPEKNTIDLIAKRIEKDHQEILELINYLHIEGMIISPRPGIYVKLEKYLD